LDERGAEVTEHAVEKGAPVSEHIIKKSPRVKLEISHSNTPIEPVQTWFRGPKPIDPNPSLFKPKGLLAVTQGISAALSSAKPTPPVIVIQSLLAIDRIQQLHDALIQAQATASLCSFTHRGRPYTDYFLEEINLSYGKTAMARFTLGLAKVRKVETALTSVPEPADISAKPPLQKGNQSKDETDSVEKEVQQATLAFKIANGVGESLNLGIQ
jgi:copper chaperone CopZ